MKLQEKQLKRWRLREEMKLEMYKTLMKFKSKEEPKLKITERDRMVVLSEILHGKLLK